MKGVFITIEGVEGCGKTTQSSLLRDHLESQGHRVLKTREPGGAAIAEKIRELLLDPANTGMSPSCELLLYAAARAQHVDEIIRPALESGYIVISDRFVDSTTAYQGAGRRIGPEAVARCHKLATRGIWPDLTILLDVPVREGLARAAREHEADRMEQEPAAFHEEVRAAFLCLADMERDRVKVVNGEAAIEAVAEAIYAHVEACLNRKQAGG